MWRPTTFPKNFLIFLSYPRRGVKFPKFSKAIIDPKIIDSAVNLFQTEVYIVKSFLTQVPMWILGDRISTKRDQSPDNPGGFSGGHQNKNFR